MKRFPLKKSIFFQTLVFHALNVAAAQSNFFPVAHSLLCALLPDAVSASLGMRNWGNSHISNIPQDSVPFWVPVALVSVSSAGNYKVPCDVGTQYWLLGGTRHNSYFRTCVLPTCSTSRSRNLNIFYLKQSRRHHDSLFSKHQRCTYLLFRKRKIILWLRIFFTHTSMHLNSLNTDTGRTHLVNFMQRFLLKAKVCF